MTTHHKSLLPTGFLLKKSNGTQNIYPRTRGHHWPVCLLSCFCSLYFSLQKSYGIISNIAATRLPDFHRQRRFRQGAYQAGQAAPASRLRVQRYGEIQPYARKRYKKVGKIFLLHCFLGRADCKIPKLDIKTGFWDSKYGLEGFPDNARAGLDIQKDAITLYLYTTCERTHTHIHTYTEAGSLSYSASSGKGRIKSARLRQITCENYSWFGIILMHLARKRASRNASEAGKRRKNGIKRRKMQDSSYTDSESYTLSFTENCL